MLTHLVALNALRAAEEKAGHIRWLRPAFQNQAANKSLQNQELLTPVSIGLQSEMALEIEQKPTKKGAKEQITQNWPNTLPDQVRAVAQVLASQPVAMTLTNIEAHFKSRGAWKKSLPRILETLEALGRARREGDGWRG